MIYLGFSLNNPFWIERYRDIWKRHWAVSKNKNIEFEFHKNSELFGFSFTFAPIARDHSGLSFSIDLLGYSFYFNFYDSRHRDHYNNRWAEY
jgi:hypothetical protein